ncbi:MAG TPA: MBL fold metallo-hydrolase, partial [Candidatus Methylomirabilis sp.]
SSFVIQLVNDAFGDPALLVGLRWERRALLFDVGDLAAASPTDLLKVQQVFVSHTHIDHFIGFDHLLRTILGRGRRVQVFGPPGIADNVAGKLAAYTWNLVEEYTLAFEVHEVHADRITATSFEAPRRWARRDAGERPFAGALLADTHFTVEAAPLDHRIPSLAFALTERFHINVLRGQVEAMGLAVGPWLHGLKRLIWGGAPDETPVRAGRGEAGGAGAREFPLGELRSRLVTITRGQKLAYVADAIYSAPNIERIVALAKGADLFYCEAAFLDRDVSRSRDRYHLTARQAGALARAAGAKRLIVFHHSPKYQEAPAELYAEARAAFEGALAAPPPAGC